jgi:twinkle protein
MPTVKDVINSSCRTVDISELWNRYKDRYEHGRPPGISTGWPGFDEYFLLLRRQLNVLSGVPGTGKSEWLESMMVNLALNQKWRVLIYSPENFPLVDYLTKLAEKVKGKSFYAIGNQPPMNIEEMGEAFEFVKEHFTFIDIADEAYGLDSILNTIKYKIEYGDRVDAVIVDPWNNVEVLKPKDISETDYIKDCLVKCRFFARKYKLSFWIVAHFTKLRRKNTGEFPEPSLYDISGSAHWYNLCDNGIILHRSDKDKQETLITRAKTAKIKNRWYGKVGEHYFEFQPWCSGYVDFKPTF